MLKQPIPPEMTFLNSSITVNAKKNIKRYKGKNTPGV